MHSWLLHHNDINKKKEHRTGLIVNLFYYNYSVLDLLFPERPKDGVQLFPMTLGFARLASLAVDADRELGRSKDMPNLNQRCEIANAYIHERTNVRLDHVEYHNRQPSGQAQQSPHRFSRSCVCEGARKHKVFLDEVKIVACCRIGVLQKDRSWKCAHAMR